MRTWLNQRIEWLRARDLKLLAALAAIGVLILLFLKLASEVSELETQKLDEAILLALRRAPDDPIGSYKVEAAMMHISALGSGVVTGLIVLLTSVFFVLGGHWRYASLLVACSVGAGIVMTLLKGLFERARPTVVTHIDPPGGMSFPSGHSMISAALYMTLAVMIARTLEQRRLRVYVVASGAFLAMLIGFTRVYLGVHYPSDVLAGWTLGLTWALICGLVVRQLGKKGVQDVPSIDTKEEQA